jgi:hypothetical protein
MRATRDGEDRWTALVRPQSAINTPILTPLNIVQTRDRILRPEMCWYTDLIPMIYQPRAQEPTFLVYPSLDRTDSSGSNGNGAVDDGKTSEYLAPLPLAFLIVGICLAVLLISLDRTIITTVRMT